MPRFTVRARRLGYFGGGRKRVGEEFTFDAASDKTVGSWMEVLKVEPTDEELAAEKKAAAEKKKDEKK